MHTAPAVKCYASSAKKIRMKFAVLGATGGTGMQFVKQALAAGHDVKAVVRNPDKLKQSSAEWDGAAERLEVVKADIFSTDSLSEHIGGVDAVVSALGFSPFSRPVTGYLESAKALVPAMNRCCCRRFFAVHSWWSGADSRAAAPFFARWFIIPIIRPCLENMDLVEKYFAEDGDAKEIQYTFVLPPQLTNGPVTDKEITAKEGIYELVNNTWKISRADVARYILTAAQEDKHKKKVVAVATS